jgi:hypothetical protein
MGDGPLGIVVLSSAFGIFVGWRYVSFLVSAPERHGLLFLLLDTAALAFILFLIPVVFERAKKKVGYYWGASAVFIALAFTKEKWALAGLHFLGLQPSTAGTWIAWPSVVLLMAAAIAYIGFIVKVILVDRTPKVVLKRGVTVRPLRVHAEEKGIVVGSFDPGILPKDMRQFVTADKGDKISLPADMLTRGISILGDPGSGKSRLMRLLHDETRRLYPDIPILIHDPKGEWLRTYYDPATDLIFAPYDKRTVNWDIFAEIKQRPELLSSIVRTAVTQHHGASKGENLYWVTSAAAIIQEHLETSEDLLSFRDGLLKWRDSHKEDKTALSAYSSARPAIKDIATIALAEGLGGKRTMDQFLNHRGRIFLLNSPMQTAEQSGAFAIFLSAFVLSCLSQPDTSKPRACTIIDEALTFHLPPTVEQAVSAQSRSKGLVMIAGAQWIPKDERRLLTRAEFTFGMKVGDLSTAKTLSELVGHAVYDEESSSKTEGSSSGGSSHDSTSATQQERRRQLMPPESFRSLPPRSFVLLHQVGIAPGYTAAVHGDQHDEIVAFDYQPQPLVSEYMKVV